MLNKSADHAGPRRGAQGYSLGTTILLLLSLGWLLCVGCGEAGKPQVVVYAALDQEFSRPLFEKFSRETGIEVVTKFDTESTKTVGLAQAIIAERDRPRCDLFWNNEVLHTLRLERLGMLRPYGSPVGEKYPASVRSPNGSWHGFAARARVLIVNTNILKEPRWPRSVKSLADPQWYDRCGIAKPLFGTTATHAACLFATMGDDKAKQFFVRVKKNARIMAGNKQVARAVAAGTLTFGLTDTDDAIVEIEAGHPVAIVYPDQREGEPGTLFIPNSLALIAGSANPDAADQLLDFLLSPEVEGRLAMGPSAQIPLHPDTQAKARVETPATIRAMEVDFAAAAESWDAAAAFLRDAFTAGN